MIARHGAVLALGKVDFLAHQQQLNDTLDLLFSNVSTAKVRPHTYNQAPTPGSDLTSLSWTVATTRSGSAKSFIRCVGVDRQEQQPQL